MAKIVIKSYLHTEDQERTFDGGKRHAVFVLDDGTEISISINRDTGRLYISALNRTVHILPIASNSFEVIGHRNG